MRMHRYTEGRKCLPHNETTDGIPLHFPDQQPSQTGSKSRRSCSTEVYLEPICTPRCYEVMSHDTLKDGHLILLCTLIS